MNFYLSNKVVIGNRNYFVMPLSVYEKVKDDIPKHVGVYVAIDRAEQISEQTPRGVQYRAEFIDGLRSLHCIKSCRKVELRADKEVILSSMLRCMQRDRARGYVLPPFDDPAEQEKQIEDPTFD